MSERKATHWGSKQQQTCAIITLLLLVHATYVWVLFFPQISLVVTHTFNATPMERLQQHPHLFTTNHTYCTFSLWNLHLARPSHPSHNTILLRSESLSDKCTKLHTVTASNNRDHAPRSLYCSAYYCLFVPYIYIFECCIYSGA